MSAFVLDCSVAVAWLFQDEATKETDLLLDKLKQDAALVPFHWRLEQGYAYGAVWRTPHFERA